VRRKESASKEQNLVWGLNGKDCDQRGHYHGAELLGGGPFGDQKYAGQDEGNQHGLAKFRGQMGIELLELNPFGKLGQNGGQSLEELHLLAVVHCSPGVQEVQGFHQWMLKVGQLQKSVNYVASSQILKDLRILSRNPN
jgi:hypothetical protein